jgi:CheY-like chemotaxis protein
MAEHEIRHYARLVKRYEEVPPVLGSEARLGQVFLNLLVNAAHAIPEGHFSDNEITLTIRAHGNDVAVEVRDTGGGIPQDVRAHLFEPFFTTKPAGRGTGLGLWICQSIVTSMGGRIRIDDAPGRGTAVLVTLPAAPGHAPPITAPSSAPGRASRLRVLVVDDDERVARLIAAVLERDETVIARGGTEALRHLASDRTFDVILCDLMMPEVGGMELYERVRELRPGLERRMVFMTGGAFTALGADFLRAHPNPCLEKPFDPQKLELALDQAARA